MVAPKYFDDLFGTHQTRQSARNSSDREENRSSSARNSSDREENRSSSARDASYEEEIPPHLEERASRNLAKERRNAKEREERRVKKEALRTEEPDEPDDEDEDDAPPPPAVRPRRPGAPLMLPEPMHPDIRAEIERIPFTPQKITHVSAPDEELNSNAEILHAVACQLQDKLRHTDLCVDSVTKLVNGTVRFLKARRELLNFRTNDTDGAIPIKPPVRPIS